MATLEYIFDFASPNAYLVHKVLPALAERNAAELVYTPCLLGGIFKATGNRSPMEAYGNISAKFAYDELEMQRFIQRHQLTAFKFNEHFPQNTLMLMRAAVAAQQQGILNRYVDAVFPPMWEQSLKMDDPAVFVSAINAAGLDGQGLLEATQDPAIKSQLIDNTTAAVTRGVFGVPTFFVGDEMFFGKERLSQVEEALQP